ncbi:general transcription factor II-I repeat domain-containing protein 2-like [Lepeophtheirus salmonis]|uniref:General transcription factor III repeat domaincontaining protein 2like [Alligator sinensis] n=1 Tax=Lepeophtheirus salmonis TaxID=72036 RepID=A0A0K2V887_LEPSM
MWELREETVMFLEMKSIQCDFSTNVFDEDWRLDFKFAIDIMEKLKEFNVKLQGNGLFAHEIYAHITSFQMKLALFLRQAGNNRFCHFPLLKEANIFGELAANYQVQLDNLAIEVGRRFQNFKNLEPQLNMFSSPFTTYVDLATEDLQLELPDLQANNDL